VLGMKAFTIFSLLIYWSIIIGSPVISKSLKMAKLEEVIVPVSKPNK
tara:strand:- start:1378 stop:1518 length:141 start_codon:yes stop_codon:yes gene_type:complete